MKSLFAFAAAFLAMAAADQDRFLSAIIMLAVSVYLFQKSFKANEHRGL